jgi:hypothetical protein
MYRTWMLVDIKTDYRSDVLQKGYTIVKQAFSSSQIQALRSQVLTYFNSGDFLYHPTGGKTKPDALNAPGLRNILWILQHAAVMEPLQAIMGKTVQFCHHSDVHLNIATLWHKDSTDYHQTNPFVPTADGTTYGVYKVAIYLQDHRSGNDYALKVRQGSHRVDNLHQGEIQTLYTQAGDVIIFDCRLTHMGQEDILRLNQLSRLINQHVARTEQRSHELRQESRRWMELHYLLRQRYRELMGIPDRLAIFYTVGKPNVFTQEHIAGNQRRQNRQNGFSASPISPDVIDHLGSGLQ